jgi:hypothetical protein
MACFAAIDSFPQGQTGENAHYGYDAKHFDESSFILNAPLTGRALNRNVGASICFGWDA